MLHSSFFDTNAERQRRKACQKEDNRWHKNRQYGYWPRPINGVIFGAGNEANYTDKNAEQRHHDDSAADGGEHVSEAHCHFVGDQAFGEFLVRRRTRNVGSFVEHVGIGHGKNLVRGSDFRRSKNEVYPSKSINFSDVITEGRSFGDVENVSFIEVAVRGVELIESGYALSADHLWLVYAPQ